MIDSPCTCSSVSMKIYADRGSRPTIERELQWGETLRGNRVERQRTPDGSPLPVMQTEQRVSARELVRFSPLSNVHRAERTDLSSLSIFFSARHCSLHCYPVILASTILARRTYSCFEDQRRVFQADSFQEAGKVPRGRLLVYLRSGNFGATSSLQVARRLLV